MFLAIGQAGTQQPLKSRVTYTAMVTTAATDATGNALDQNPNTAGEQPKVWKFTVKR